MYFYSKKDNVSDLKTSAWSGGSYQIGSDWYADIPLTEMIRDEQSFASLPFHFVDNTKK